MTTSTALLPEDYVRFSPITAEIFLHDNSRILAVNTTFLRTVASIISERQGDPFPVFYRMGFLWGNQAYAYLENLIRAIFPSVSNIRDLSMSDFHRLFAEHLARMGWGHFELKRRDDFLFVDLEQSVVADFLSGQTGPSTVCSLYAGFFAGIFGRISEMDLGCVEVTCKHDGYENCAFLLDTHETIDQFNAHRRKGDTPLQTFEKMKSALGER
jgi:predicted hydrocarbon binding protein